MEPSNDLPGWWPGREEQPLVYVTFGSVAGSFPQALPAYGLALSAVADLPVRVLLTVGRDLDLDALPATPDNVRVEPWVPQQDVLGHAAAAVVHGGSGSTLGALAAGVPLVVVPLFADQPQNARRVAEVGAGLAVEPDRDDIPATIAPLRAAIEEVLSEPSYGERAQALAAELRAEPPVDDGGTPVATPRSPLSSSVWPSIPLQRDSEPVSGQVWLLADNPREPELVFDSAFNEDLNEAVKELPAALVRLAAQALARAGASEAGQAGRGAARAVPGSRAEPRRARLAERLGPLARRLQRSSRARAAATSSLRTLQGDRPEELDRGTDAGDGPHPVPVQRRERCARRGARRPAAWTTSPPPARACSSSVRRPPAAEMTIQLGEDGEPHFTVFHIWDRAPAVAFRELSEAHPIHRPGRFFLRDARGEWPCPPTRRSRRG